MDPRKRGGEGGQETGEGRKASARTARLRRPERGAGTQKSMQEGAEEGGGEAPQEQLGLRGARTPAPLGLVALRAVGCGRAPGSRLLHAASLAQQRPPPPRAPAPLAFPGVGLVTKVPAGVWSGELVAASHLRAVPAPGPHRGQSRGAVSPPGLLIWKELERPFC